MKIAFDYQIFSQQSYGGISRYYNTLASNLSRLDQDISIFAGIHRNKYLSSLPKSLVRGYELPKYPLRSTKLFLLANHYLTNYQINQWSPDLIHETYYSIFKPTFNHLPRIVTAYDMVHELFPRQFKKKELITQRKKSSFDRADHIISISHNTKKDLIDGYIHFSKKEQLNLTLKKHFFKQDKLVLLEIEVLNLENLRWEKSQTKDLFPHLYSILKLKNVKNVFKIILNSDGTHKLPSNLQ